MSRRSATTTDNESWIQLSDHELAERCVYHVHDRVTTGGEHSVQCRQLGTAHTVHSRDTLPRNLVIRQSREIENVSFFLFLFKTFLHFLRILEAILCLSSTKKLYLGRQNFEPCEKWSDFVYL